MKTLSTLISLSQEKIDEKRKKIAALDSEKTSYEMSLAKLKEEIEREQQFVDSLRSSNSSALNLQILSSYENYYAQNLRSQSNTSEQIKRLDGRLETLREELREVFLEMKKYEILQESQKLEQLQSEQKSEEKEIEEINASSFNHSQEDQ